ncbi:MAG: rhomboid family intramembrane serine protease [Pirellulales bacterium]|nr:rhomboid family intramembrane serine protease [Pirellulales bacterium]
MRKLHTFEQELDANRFTAVLTVNQVEAQVLRSNDNQWDLWIIDEDALSQAGKLLGEYQSNPDSPQIQMALAKAKKIQQQLKQEKAERIKQAKKIEVRTQFRDPHHMMAAMQRKDTLTRKIILLCAIVFGASLVFQSQDGSQENFVRNALEAQFQQISQGQIWRLITPVFVHGTGQEFLFDFLHIFFNMYWMYWLGTRLEIQFGLKTYLGLFLIAGVASILVPLLTPETGLLGIRGLGGGSVVGMSGVVYGVIGFGWCKMKMKPSVGMLITPFVLMFSIGWMLFGIVSASSSQEVGYISSISHLAHLVGLLTGAMYAFVHTKLGK